MDLRNSFDVASLPRKLRGEDGEPEMSQENLDYLATTLEGLKSLRYQAFDNRKPWMDEEGRLIWSPFRVKLAKIVFSQYFETAMGIIIVGNLCLIMFEADHDARCYPAYDGRMSECPFRSDTVSWISVLNAILLVLYSLECGVRFFVERTLFFCNTWNMIDLLIVCLGWISYGLASVVNLSLLRLSRLVRVLRAVRVFISVPEFYLLITGLYSSIKAIIFGSMMLLSFILFWAVITVELLHPLTSSLTYSECERCSRGFASVATAGVTLFQQIVAGDSWGAISIPLVEAFPWTGPMLFIIMMTISMGIMNLILAVIVERAAEARENDHEAKIRKKDQERSKNMIDLAVLCASMDKNNNGLLSLDEMESGYDQLEAFRKLMQQMDIKRDEMQVIFNVLDSDNSGEVSYLEFCQNLGSFLKRDPVIMHSLVQCSVLELRKMIREEVADVMHTHHQEVIDGQNRILVALGLEPQSPRTMTSTRTSTVGRSRQKAFARQTSPTRAGRESRHSSPATTQRATSPKASSTHVQALQKVESELQVLLEKADKMVATVGTDIPSPRLPEVESASIPEELISDEQLEDLWEGLQDLSEGFEQRAKDATLLQNKTSELAAALKQNLRERRNSDGLRSDDSSEFAIRLFKV
ncbi:unnamed protein product [Effrenium voratum]|nr:unnamed protein product [Effrenium voratum]|mmetsp:Transcript_98296/g.233932  ORF Transcript_98296/g.233932 Transcript_98296/m.233932 type:complete len:640 (+) Transcript_98296:64-1983(+)|eukprot:CAMPEP_0181408346 /NCGR_PEP_ID=MMETSP1110-20121109/6250_1 /TAXON_ID=174948 /ORGANISM="Symbiodinium sp., Strain CCMP421" /LENGTH=639 /DNA_ID=CAMNT_0023530807 /DNA_START=41 /DNA_END=1960 /DNA_ORIENTATION=-